MVIGGLVITSFTGLTSKALAGDATLTLDDNAGSSSFVVQDVDKANQFKVNSDGQGYFAGNVGIGTTGPTGLLTVYSSDSSGKFRIGQNSSSDYSIWRDSATGFLQFNGSQAGFIGYVFNNGNLGIGTTAPTERLDVAGNIKASSTVSQGSSKEYKKNISHISTKEAMKTLNGLNPVRFEYKTDNSGEKHLGFIAEDVPDLVAEEDRKHLNSMDITAVLTKVVQEQQRQIEQLQDEISELKKLGNANGI